MAGKPLTLDELCQIMQVASRKKIQDAIEEIRMDYAKRDSPIEIVHEGESYKMEVRSEYLAKVKDLAPQMDMSRAILKILSFIAYKQPVKQSDLVEKFGNRVYDYVKELKRRGLIKAEDYSRTKRLTTTKNLLSYLGEHDGGKIKKALEHAKQEAERERLAKEAGKKKPQGYKPPSVKKEMEIDDWISVVDHEKQKKFEKQMETFEEQFSSEDDDEEFEAA